MPHYYPAAQTPHPTDFPQLTPIKKALLSVYNKEKLLTFGKFLVAAGVELYSSSGTYQTLQQAGIAVKTVESLTEYGEILAGRVKTLHPRIHGGILMQRNNPQHQETAEKLNLTPFDLIVINLYPFEKATDPKPLPPDDDTSPTAQPLQGEEIDILAALEMIDIGGPTLLRSAAKNFPFVTVASAPDDYAMITTSMTQTGGTPLALRQRLAIKAFEHTAHYDMVIARRLSSKIYYKQFTYLEKLTTSAPHASLAKTSSPTQPTLSPTNSSHANEFSSQRVLRYGENPQQQAVLQPGPLHLQEPFSLAQAIQLRGKTLSYNNLLDAEAAIKIIRDFHFHLGQTALETTENSILTTGAVVIKHGIPCGFGCAPTLKYALKAALEGDIVSRYGSIIAFTHPVDAETALLLKNIFVEVLIAPEYEKQALAMLQEKNKNMCLLQLPGLLAERKFPEVNELRHLTSATLHQTRNENLFHTLNIVSQPASSAITHHDNNNLSLATTQIDRNLLVFTNITVKHTKSNAITLAGPHYWGKGGYMLLGIGSGQPNRLAAVSHLALPKCKENITRLYPQDKIPAILTQIVLASDAFFPFADNLDPIHASGIRTIIQPGGSIRDPEVIARAKNLGLTMIFTQQRHFLH